MEQQLTQLIFNLSYIALPFILALVFAEVARGYVAYFLGDKTGKSMGRLTLDPSKHIDPINTIIMPIAVYLATNGMVFFGSAKPIPISTGNFHPLRKALILISLARAMSHFIQALVWAIIGLLAQRFFPSDFIIQMANAGLLINCMLFAFILLPIPPYDGGNIIACLLPFKQAIQFESLARYSIFILLALIFSNILFTFWLWPIVKLLFGLIHLLLSPFAIIL